MPAPEASESLPVSEATTPAAETTSPAPEQEENRPISPGATVSSAPATQTTAPGTATPGVSSTPDRTPATQPAPSQNSTAPTPSPTGTSPADVCNGEEEPTLDENLSTTLSGLPSKVVAGSGFHAFKLNVVNSGTKAYQRVDLGVFAAQIDADTWEETTGHLALQFKNPDTGHWTDISLDAHDEGAGYLGHTDVRAKEALSIDMRLSVDKEAPEGFGFAITIGVYADDQGNCVFAGDQKFYEFDILAAGTEPWRAERGRAAGGWQEAPPRQARRRHGSQPRRRPRRDRSRLPPPRHRHRRRHRRPRRHRRHVRPQAPPLHDRHLKAAPLSVIAHSRTGDGGARTSKRRRAPAPCGGRAATRP